VSQTASKSAQKSPSAKTAIPERYRHLAYEASLSVKNTILVYQGTPESGSKRQLKIQADASKKHCLAFLE